MPCPRVHSHLHPLLLQSPAGAGVGQSPQLPIPKHGWLRWISCRKTPRCILQPQTPFSFPESGEANISQFLEADGAFHEDGEQQSPSATIPHLGMLDKAPVTQKIFISH